MEIQEEKEEKVIKETYEVSYKLEGNSLMYLVLFCRKT